MLKEFGEDVAFEFLGLKNTKRPAMIVPCHNIMQFGIGENSMHLRREAGHVSCLGDRGEGVFVNLGGVIPVVEIWGRAEFGSVHLASRVKFIRISGFLAPLGLLLFLGRFGCEVIIRPGVVELIPLAFGCFVPGITAFCVCCRRHGRLVWFDLACSLWFLWGILVGYACLVGAEKKIKEREDNGREIDVM